MRKRNPVILAVVGFAVLLGVLLVVASTRRAVHDPSLATATSVTPARSPSTTPAMSTFTSGGAVRSTGAAASTRPTVAPTSNAAPARATTSGPAFTAPKGMGSVRAGSLPVEGQETLRLIDAGGPFPYKQDGVVFENREKQLPARATGYYHEYTVETPGSPDRGARRIIVGGAGERYYTSDHYATFRLVVP